jgi:hypothetical protein
MSSRAIGFGSMPVDSGTHFIVVTPWSPPAPGRSCSPRTGSIVFLLHCLLRGIQEWIGLTNLAATGNALGAIFAIVAA